MTKDFFVPFLAITVMTFSCALSASAGDSSSFTPSAVTAVAPKAGSVPVGTIIIWPTSSNPEGWSEGKWLACNGQAVSSSSYPELAALGFSSVPNLNERVPWGVNSSPGQYREAGLPNITGEFPNGNERNNFTPSGAFYKTSNTNSTAWDATSYPNTIAMDASRSSAIYGRSSTVQPPAYTVRYLIRAKP